MEEFKQVKRCEYENCVKVLEGRSNKKYCCRRHKDYARIYRKRRDKFLVNAIKINQQKVDSYRQLYNQVVNNR